MSTSGIHKVAGLEFNLFIACLGCLAWQPTGTSGLLKKPARLTANVQYHEDHYVLLSEDELTKNADMLRHLAMASKEEIEDLVAGNPMIQQTLLRKIEDIIRIKEESGTLGAVSDHKFEVVDDHDHEIVEELDDYDDELERERLQAIKTKLKSKAAKLLRIGDGFKRKLVELGHKKLKKFKKRRRPPVDHRHHHDDADDDDDDDEEDHHDHLDSAERLDHPRPPLPAGAPPYAQPAAAGAPRFHFNVSTSKKRRRRRRRRR